MARLKAAALLGMTWLLLGDLGRADLTPSKKGQSFRRVVHERLCYAGRFRFEQWDRARDVYLGRFVETMPSSEGHPNAENRGEVYVLPLGDEDFRPEMGRIYCLILTAGSKRGMTIEAFGPDDAVTARQMKEVIESPSAFENDATWRKRRALWAKFRTDLGPGETPLLYGEDDSLQRILYVEGGDGPFPLHLYDRTTGKSEPIIHAKVLAGMNRITFADGQFLVWFNGSVELQIGVGGGD